MWPPHGLAPISNMVLFSIEHVAICFYLEFFLWVSTSAVRKVWKNLMWNATIISWTWTTAHRYTNFDAMEQFHRFNVPEFYLQCLGNYVNPLCVPWPWWKCFQNPMQRVFLVFTSPPHRHTPIHVRRSLDFIHGCWKHVAALLDLCRNEWFEVFSMNKPLGLNSRWCSEHPLNCRYAYMQSWNRAMAERKHNSQIARAQICIFWCSGCTCCWWGQHRLVKFRSYLPTTRKLTKECQCCLSIIVLPHPQAVTHLLMTYRPWPGSSTNGAVSTRSGAGFCFA